MIIGAIGGNYNIFFDETRGESPLLTLLLLTIKESLIKNN
jgi:hypothetical protein